MPPPNTVFDERILEIFHNNETVIAQHAANIVAANIVQQEDQRIFEAITRNITFNAVLIPTTTEENNMPIRTPAAAVPAPAVAVAPVEAAPIIPIDVLDYYELALVHPDLVRRYVPDLRTIEGATQVLRHAAKDVKMTTAEKVSLEKYVAYHSIYFRAAFEIEYVFNQEADGNNFNYAWCETCTKMVGFGAHGHCRVCNHPDIHLAQCGCSTGCGHCNHRACNACEKCITRPCASCNKCESCCECTFCHGCDRLATCRACGDCVTHCECPLRAAEEAARIAARDGTAVTPAVAPRDPDFDGGRGNRAFDPRPWRAGPLTKKEFNCSRLAGVEWEFNRVRSNELLSKWQDRWRSGVHYDGSCGLEAVTSPMAGDHLVHALRDLGDCFNKSAATADDRCGIHVHVDARDVLWEDMFRLLKVYAKVEPILYLLGGQDRLANRYCAPAGKVYLDAVNKSEKEDRKGAILAVAFGINDTKRAREHCRNGISKEDGGRYRGLNICPWLAGRKNQNHGYKRRSDTTVEFRIHRNSLDSEQVINWAKVCVRLVDWVTKHSDKDVADLPKSALRVLCMVAPECAPWILRRVQEWRKETSFDKSTKKRLHARKIKLSKGKYTAIHAFLDEEEITPVPYVAINTFANTAWTAYTAANIFTGTGVYGVAT